MRVKKILGVKNNGVWIVTIPLSNGSWRIGRGKTLEEAIKEVRG